MRDIQNKTDGTGDILSALAFNTNFIAELQGLVESADFTLDVEAGPDTDTAMFRKAIAHYATAGSYFSDGGSADNYVLSRVGNLQPLASYKDGTIVVFKAANSNSGASVINVDSIGSVDLVRSDGSALKGGEILENRYYVCRYIVSNANFEIVNDEIDFATSTDTNNAYWRDFASWDVGTGSSLTFQISATNGNHNEFAVVNFRTYKSGPTVRRYVNILSRSGYTGLGLFQDDDSFGMAIISGSAHCYIKQQILDLAFGISYDIKLLSKVADNGFELFTFNDSVAATGPTDYSAGLSDNGLSVYSEGNSGLGSDLTAALMELDPAPSSDLTGFGIYISATVDVNATGITAALFKAADFNYEEADASATTTAPCTAMALESGTGIKNVLLQGTIRNDAWAWVAGQIFLSETAGAFTQTAPTTTGTIVQCVGYAISATVMYFNPSMDYGVNA